MTRTTENHIRREKQYKHVPTHAISSFLRTTTPPTMGLATGTVLDDIALGDLDPGVVTSGALAPGRDAEGVSVPDRATPDGATPDELILR